MTRARSAATTGVPECPDVSVVMPVHNKAALAARCAGALLEAAAEAERRQVAVEVLFVDHCSTDGADVQLREEIVRAPVGVRARLIAHSGGTVSAVRNAGVRASRAPLLCFVDSDCLVPRSFLTDVVATGRETGADVFGCQYDPPADGHWSERVWDDLHNPRTDGFRAAMNGGDLIVRREALAAVGGWDERLSAGEDDALCLRLSEAGYRIFEVRRLAVVHLGNPKSISEFFRKQRWHGAGTLDSPALRWRRMALMIYAFMLLCAVAAAALLLLDVRPLARAAVAAALVLAVPTAAAALRCVLMRRWVSPVPAVALYCVYFAARSAAMLDAVRRRLAHRRHRAATPAAT
jgi:GT2 family glycosyltransferase